MKTYSRLVVNERVTPLPSQTSLNPVNYSDKHLYFLNQSTPFSHISYTKFSKKLVSYNYKKVSSIANPKKLQT